MLNLSPVSQRELPAILLIDDDLVSREVAATLLTLSGYTVHTAECGEAALKMLAVKQCEPGMILSDAQMPGLSGVDLIRELRAACKGVPIYVISASRPAESLVAAADGLLLKPFDATTLWKLFEQKPAQPKESFLSSGEPVVSADVLNKLRQMMTEKAVRQIYAAMVDDLDRRLEALGAAIERHDGQEVRRIGHTIKGGCSMAGALQAARLGALLEAEPVEQDNHLGDKSTLLADLRTAARELRRMLEGELPA
jgi:CheY-like chemotaxis protein